MTRSLRSPVFLFKLRNILLCFGVLVWTVSCQSAIDFSFQDVQCKKNPDLDAYFATKEKLLGCLVLVWAGQTKEDTYSKPLVLNKNGQFSLRTTESEPAEGLKLPDSAKNRAFLMRMYLFTKEESEKLEKGPLASHTFKCLPMGVNSPDKDTPSYDCFHPTNKECWMMLQLEPDDGKSGRLFTQDKSGTPIEGRCNVCTREICGDGKDNNCDGRVDDYDEVKNQECKKP